MNILRNLSTNRDELRRQLIEVISMLNRWYRVKEDLIYAFGKVAESDIKEPSKSIIQAFVVRINSGMDLTLALQMMSESYKHPSFKYFIKQIDFNLKYRGKIGDLLDAMEYQFMKIEDEHTRRKISTGKDRRSIKFIYLITLILTVLRLFTNRISSDFFLGHPLGRFLLFISGVVFVLGYLAFAYMERKDYEI